MEALNLDGMEVEELEEFAANRDGNPRLIEYARAKAKAIRFRIAGEISNALHAEGQADKVYWTLPESLRW